MNLDSITDRFRNLGEMDGPTRQRLMVIITGVLVALWAGDKLLLTPLTKVWTDRNDRIVRLRKELADGEQLLQREGGIRERWQQMQSNALPSSVSQAESRMLSAFDSWSRDSEITVTSVKPQWKRQEEDHASLECRVDAAGSLSAITRFLYQVEHDPLAMKVDVLELNSRDTTGAQISLGLQVSGLVLKPEERATQ